MKLEIKSKPRLIACINLPCCFKEIDIVSSRNDKYLCYDVQITAKNSWIFYPAWLPMKICHELEWGKHTFWELNKWSKTLWKHQWIIEVLILKAGRILLCALFGVIRTLLARRSLNSYELKKLKGGMRWTWKIPDNSVGSNMTVGSIARIPLMFEASDISNEPPLNLPCDWYITIWPSLTMTERQQRLTTR